MLNSQHLKEWRTKQGVWCIKRLKSTIKMYECEFRGFTARCKPLDEPKDKKARLDFARNKVLSPFFPNSLDKWKQDKWLKVKHYTRIKGRKKYGEAKEQLMFMLWHGWQLNGSLGFIHYVTGDRSTRTCEVCRAILSCLEGNEQRKEAKIWDILQRPN